MSARFFSQRLTTHFAAIGQQLVNIHAKNYFCTKERTYIRQVVAKLDKKTGVCDQWTFLPSKHIFPTW